MDALTNSPSDVDGVFSVESSHLQSLSVFGLLFEVSDAVSILNLYLLFSFNLPSDVDVFSIHQHQHTLPLTC